MRYLAADLEKTLANDRKMAFVVGPRQVGKTTLARSLLGKDPDRFPEAAYFNWDNEETRRRILKKPDDFWRPEEGTPPPRILLDEIHKYPRWKRFLKGFFDAHRRQLEVLVTGSGRLDVYQRGGDSLFGRYHLYHLMPYSVGELVDQKRDLSPDACLKRVFEEPAPACGDAYQNLWRLNGFPEPLFGGDERTLQKWQNDHEQLILREDLRDLTQIREIGLIQSMIQLLPERIGSPLSINALREDLGVNFKTVQNWIGALDKLYFLFALRPYAGRLARTLRREEKVYFYDWSILEDPSKRVENFVAVHLLKSCLYWTDEGYGKFELHYVRDKDKREVDFLITNKSRPFLLAEVKLAEKEIDRSLTYFQERLKPNYAFQIVGETKPGFLSERGRNLWSISAGRFLGGLV